MRFIPFAVPALLVFVFGLGVGHAERIKFDPKTGTIGGPSSAPATQDTLIPDHMVRWRTLQSYPLVFYSFEGSPHSQGWERVDNTDQVDSFFHVDDFAGLGGGSHGGLVPVDGTKSMWCGTRGWEDPPPTERNELYEYLCSWPSAPGYGNNWIQILGTDPVAFTDTLTLTYDLRYDLEGGYDYVTVEYYDSLGEDWVERVRYDQPGVTELTDTLVFLLTQSEIVVQFVFRSDAGWSDQDPFLDTDGAVILDNIELKDVNGQIDFEDFETATVGAKSAGLWHAIAGQGYGLFSWIGSGLTDYDPCLTNDSYQWIFNLTSRVVPPAPYVPEVPEYGTPLCAPDRGYMLPHNEMVVSPIIDLSKYSLTPDQNQGGDIPAGDLARLGPIELYFEAYNHLPLDLGVYYYWHVRGVDASGCPGPWQPPYVYYSNSPVYVCHTENIADLIGDDAVGLQVALGLIDMNCHMDTHTPAPYFDNVLVTAKVVEDPQWAYDRIELFQDNFPGSGGYVRADMAKDVSPPGGSIRPGDSVVVMCSSKCGDGIAIEMGLPMVRMHVKCTGTNLLFPKSPLYGPSLEGTYGPYVSDDGTWTIINGLWANPEHTKFMFDLNDSLFTAGYKIEYYFKAYNRQGGSSTLPSDAETDQDYFEFTCLPSLNDGGIIIQWPIDSLITGRPPFPGLPINWDDVIDRNAENDPIRFFNLSFDAVLPDGSESVDIYDVYGWDQLGSNGLASRLSLDSLMHYYDTIIWDSGRIPYGMISDGSQGATGGNKQDDVSLLIDWLTMSDHSVNLFILGDNIAAELNSMPSIQAAYLMELCGVGFNHTNYFELTGGYAGGGEAHPMVESVAGAGPFPEDRSFYAYGGQAATSCVEVDDFDVLGTTGTGAYALQYMGNGGSYYAAVYNQDINEMFEPINTVWFGFSFMNIRDVETGTPIVRNQILSDVLTWMGRETNPDITGVNPRIGYSNHLDQNVPNPFNPSTRVKYGVLERGQVSIRIYDVAGRLVKTLVDETKNPGGYAVTWNGDNNQGQGVASGIYFCRMNAKGFLKTRKMVLLR